MDKLHVVMKYFYFDSVYMVLLFQLMVSDVELGRPRKCECDDVKSLLDVSDFTSFKERENHIED